MWLEPRVPTRPLYALFTGTITAALRPKRASHRRDLLRLAQRLIGGTGLR